MTNPFKPGDTVYDLQYGEGRIHAINGSRCIAIFNKESFNSLDVSYEVLSFEPQAKPVHVRPIKIGWHVVKFAAPNPQWGDASSRFLMHYNGSGWSGTPTQHGAPCAPANKHTSVRFITANEDITKD